MSAWVPLFQTLAWVLLIAGILWRFNSEVRSLIKVLRERIERGSSVEAGPFKLGASAPGQGLDEQRQRLQAEVSEAAPGTDVASQLLQPRPGASRSLGSTVLLAEDLAIRRIQSEFGASASRQVRLGRDLDLDGLIALRDIVYGIEVKYSFRALNVDAVKGRVSRILDVAPKSELRRFAVILALVYADVAVLTVAEKARVSAALESFGDQVVTRFYLFDDLARGVGLDG